MTEHLESCAFAVSSVVKVALRREESEPPHFATENSIWLGGGAPIFDVHVVGE